ncbi:MAG TPA: type II toxin-antitoxin system RelE/ParE family toxin, partial [Thermoanaerobaculia bacterium]|nr:type II toxin-antitoxin system RelE/ParE family toxin [Thermoanaerobaculia bacterium]
HAEKSLERLARSDRSLFLRVDGALGDLAANATAGKALHGPLAGRRSYRVGPLRIIYRFNPANQEVFVLDIASRGDAYRDRE